MGVKNKRGWFLATVGNVTFVRRSRLMAMQKASWFVWENADGSR